MSTCFHCGLAIPEDQDPPVLDVEGTRRAFCCHGCQAVCRAILEAGLVDYYHHRSSHSATASQSVIPEFLSRIELYDRAEIQQAFVDQQQDWNEASLLLENIRCPACLWLNEKHLRSLPGVLDVHIDDVTQRARVRWNPQVIKLSRILTAVAEIGYIAHPYDATRSERLQKLRRRRSIEKLIFAAAAGMLVMNFSLATYFMGGPDATGQLPLWIVIGRWTSLMLSALIMAYPGQEFFAGAWEDLRNRRLGMDIPVVLGLCAAFAGSLSATITASGEVYFDSIAMFVFFLLLARRYELGGKIKAADHIERLARVIPGTAQRIGADGSREDVAVEDLVAGDRISLLPGQTVPVDGSICRGTSSFDESLLTGESVPVLRQPGDAIVAGAVNGDQPVVMTVTKTVQASALSEIRKLVDLGLEKRPRYALLAERVASGFVAVILVVAIVTAGYWLYAGSDNWLPNTIAVLIVTCPCALALATPVALTVTAGQLIELGIVPLRMAALDALARSDHFVFDKTGTLTAGQPRLVRVVSVSDMDQEQVLHVATAMSVDSEHPLARALRKAVGKVDVSVESVRIIPGAGICAEFDGTDWRFGKPTFATGQAMDDETAALVETCQSKGQTVSLLAGKAGVQAVFIFEDPLRDGIKTLLQGLAETGVAHFSLLSGDASANVNAIGQRLGIKDCHGNMSPAGKLAWINQRQQAGGHITMFGDGINDAPALAAADVSISFSSATDLANVSSDLLLLGDHVMPLVQAKALAMRMRRNIMQNFGWAAAYNIIAIPFAALGYIPPWGAAIGMSVSSLFIVMNALRIRSSRPHASDSHASHAQAIHA